MSLALEHFDAELPFARELLRLLGEIGRRADVAGQVAEIPGERHAGGDRAALGRPRAAAACSRLARKREHHCASARARASSCSSSRRSGRALRRRRASAWRALQARSRSRHRQLGEAEVSLGRAGVGGRAHRRAHRLAVFLRSELGFARPARRAGRARAATPASAKSMRVVPGLPSMSPCLRRSRSAPRAARSRSLRGGRELARFEYADHETRRRGLLRCAGLSC